MVQKIVIFSRTSTTQQDVEQQTEALINEAIRLGYSKKNQIIVEYQESGIKLNAETRKGIKKLKQVIEDNLEIDCMICWELTRIARRADVIYNIRDFLVEHKIRWVVCKPYMELIDRDGKVTQVSSLMLGIFSSFAESEMMIKLERFKRARADMKTQGKKFGGATIFGYIKNENKQMELHPLHSAIVSQIFDHYANDTQSSLYSTYVWATSKWPSLFPAMEYKKSQRVIKRMFDREVYWEGNWCYPAFISKELHQKVYDKAQNAQSRARFFTKHQWLGRGKFYCKHCGGMLTPTGGATKAYVCSTDKLHNMTLNTDALEWLIWEEARVVANIKATISRNDVVIDAQTKLNEKNNLLGEYDNKINELEQKQEKLVEIYLEGKVNKNIYDNKNNEIEEEIKGMVNKRNKVNEEILELSTIITKSKEGIFDKPINYDEVDNFDTKLEIVRECIDKVYVEKVENKVYELEFTYKGVIVPQPGKYRYISKNQFKKIWRINQDETEDLIYNETAHPMKRDEHGNFIK